VFTEQFVCVLFNPSVQTCNFEASKTMSTTGIKNSYSLLAWTRGYTVKLVPAHKAVDRNGKEFDAPQSIALINDEDGSVNAFAAFSSSLEAMSAAELVAQAKDLNVVELNSGTFKVCRPGEGSWKTLNF
jgi:hypothetical protein